MESTAMGLKYMWVKTGGRLMVAWGSFSLMTQVEIIFGVVLGVVSIVSAIWAVIANRKKVRLIEEERATNRKQDKLLNIQIKEAELSLQHEKDHGQEDEHENENEVHSG